MQAECEGNRSIARQLHSHLSHGMEVTERLYTAERNDMERVDKELDKDYAEEVQRVRIRK